MYYVTAVLLVLAGLFYAAGHHEIGSLGVEMCRYGSTFCDNPIYVLAGAALAAPGAALLLNDFPWESRATDGLALVLLATGVALAWAGLTGRRPDWIE